MVNISGTFGAKLKFCSDRASALTFLNGNGTHFQTSMPVLPLMLGMNGTVTNDVLPSIEASVDADAWSEQTLTQSCFIT